MKYLVPLRVEKIEYGYLYAGSALDRLLLAVLRWKETLTNESAIEYCVYGLGRRTKRIRLCLSRFQKIFEKEAAGKKISDKLRFEETAFLNMFFIDLSGALDNLAQALILENGIDQSINKISLQNPETLKHMPVLLKESMRRHSRWLQEHLANFRNPVAHRIAPYVPPYIQTKSGKRIYDSFYIHDFKKSKLMLLHPQVIKDVNILCEIVQSGIARLPHNAHSHLRR